jgi:GTP cyclohydrolase IA
MPNDVPPTVTTNDRTKTIEELESEGKIGIGQVRERPRSEGGLSVPVGRMNGDATASPNNRRDSVYQAVEALMRVLPIELSPEAQRETPRRLTDYLLEFCQPVDAMAILKEGFENLPRDGGMVVQQNIPLRGLCEHHFAPFFGYAHIAYLPRKRVVGLSKLARLVDAIGTASPSMQERMSDVIADILDNGMEPNGVMVVTEAMHTCMSVRGVHAPGVITTSSALRGLFLMNPTAKSEALALMNNRKTPSL